MSWWTLEGKKGESFSAVSVAFAPCWHQTSLDSSAEFHCSDTFQTSQPRSCFFAPYPSRDGDATAVECRLDVWQLQKAQSQERVVLRPVRVLLGRLHCLPQAEELRSEVVLKKILLDGAGSWPMDGRSSREESQTESKTQECAEKLWQRAWEVSRAQWAITATTCAPHHRHPLLGQKDNNHHG